MELNPKTQKALEAGYSQIADVENQVFFTKLASAGIQPQNEAEAASLVELGMVLESQEAADPQNRFADLIKSASDTQNDDQVIEAAVDRMLADDNVKLAVDFALLAQVEATNAVG